MAQHITVKVDASDVPGMSQLATAARDVVDAARPASRDEYGSGMRVIPGVMLDALEQAVKQFRPGREV